MVTAFFYSLKGSLTSRRERVIPRMNFKTILLLALPATLTAFSSSTRAQFVAAEHVKVPCFAIGGINLQNLDEVLKAGARTICVVSAILNADNVAAACRGFAERMERAVPRIP